MYNGKTTLKEADEDQNSLLVYCNKKKSVKPRENARKKDLLKKLYALFIGKERVCDAFGSKKLPIKI